MDGAIREQAKGLRDDLRSQLEQLARAVDARKRDAGFRKALETMAAFWSYSPFNQFLIGIQRRDATRVAGRTTWERLGRTVKEGERPISILAPTRGAFGYVEVPVYDLRQTSGRRIAWLRTELRGESEHVETLRRAAGRLGIEVAFVAQEAGKAGTSHGGRIEVSPRLGTAEQVRVLAHELAHEVLHQEERARAAARKRPPPERTRAEKETEADATSWVVLRALGLRAPPSPTYIAWQGGTGADVLRSMGRIQRAARRILKAAGACPGLR
jgi:hypothetical protein